VVRYQIIDQWRQVEFQWRRPQTQAFGATETRDEDLQIGLGYSVVAAVESNTFVVRWRSFTADRMGKKVMKTKFTLALIAGAALLTGCWQKSVYPFYKEKDVFFEAKLIGTWHEADKAADEGTTWTFSKGESANVYQVHIADKDQTKLDCDGRLFKLGETKFLDLQSRDRGVITMPAHALFRVLDIGETFKLQMLSPGWFKNRLQLHPKEIGNIFVTDPEHPDDVDKGEFVLTANTEAVQKYLMEHLKDEGFWEEPGELKKVK
jgi:hypothetical protein